nr:ATP-binding protein [Algoriphagus sp.]
MEAFSKLGTYYLLEDRDSSSFYLDKALPIAVNLNLKLDEASILNAMGIILMQQEKFSKSLELYLKSINILKDPDIEKTIWNLPPGQTPTKARMLELSKSYDLIGLLNAYTGNWSENIKNQKKNYREAEKYALAAEDTVQIATINFHMGIAYLNEGKLDSAFKLISEAISTFSILKDLSMEGRALKYLGDTYSKMGNLDLAATTLQKSRALLLKTNDYVHLGLTYISLNRAYTDLKKYDSAFYYAKEGLKLFEKRKDPVGKKDVYNLIASYFDRQGITDSASVYLKLAKSLSDSLNTEERKNLLEFHDVVIEEQKKLENLERESILTRSRTITYNMIAGLVILSLIGLILYRNNKKEKKAKIILENALNELKSTQAQLIQQEKLASLGQLTAGIAHEIKNPLNFVNNFSEVSVDLIGETLEEMEKGEKRDHTLIRDNLEDLQSNLRKIREHGARANTIVTSMLQHSRGSSGKKEPTDLNVFIKESVNLSYHGMRAGKNPINVEINLDLDPKIHETPLIKEDFSRVIINLCNNAFDAMRSKTLQGFETLGGLELYQPKLTVRTKSENDHMLILIEDNGPGIPEEIKEKILQPFFTTKKGTEGTGLGLSIAHDIVKAHGGELKVKTKEGEGTEFIIQLPIV